MSWSHTIYLMIEPILFLLTLLLLITTIVTVIRELNVCLNIKICKFNIGSQIWVIFIHLMFVVVRSETQVGENLNYLI